MTTAALIGLIVGLGVSTLVILCIVRPTFRVFERVTGVLGGARWSEKRARDELAGLTDAINAVDVPGDIGADAIRAGHYERAIDARDEAERAIDAGPRRGDLRGATASIKEGRRELRAAGAPVLGVSGAALGALLAREVTTIWRESSTALHSNPPLATGPHATADLTPQLGKLADLRDRGVLTEAELEAQKQRLLEG